jgi:hypothetical protein
MNKLDDRKLKQYLLQEVVQIQSMSSQKSEPEQYQIALKSANNMRLLLVSYFAVCTDQLHPKA